MYHHARSSETGICPNTTPGMTLASCSRCRERNPEGCRAPWWDLGMLLHGPTGASKPCPPLTCLTPWEAVPSPKPQGHGWDSRGWLVGLSTKNMACCRVPEIVLKLKLNLWTSRTRKQRDLDKIDTFEFFSLK